MKKSYLTLVVILMITTLNAQNKKEQIAALTHQIDSLNMELQITRNNASIEVAKLDSIIKSFELEINVITGKLNESKSNVSELIEKEKKLSEEIQNLNNENEKLRIELETKGQLVTIITHDAVGKVKLGMSLDELEGIAIVIQEIIGLEMDGGQEVIIATFVDDSYTVAVSCDDGNPRKINGIAALGPNFVTSEGWSMPMTVEQLKILYPDLTWGSGEGFSGYFLTTELSNIWFFVSPSNIPDKYSYMSLTEENKFPADITVSYIGVGWGVRFF